MDNTQPLSPTNAPFAKTTHLIGIILSVTAGIFAYSDKLSEIFSINPQIAQWWPIILAAATTIDRIAKLVISILSSFKSWPIILLCFFFTGCVSTKVYDSQGHLRFATGGDAGNVSYTNKEDTLSIQQLDHSKSNKITADTTKAMGGGIITTATILAK